MDLTRRRLLELGLLAIPLPAVLAACGGSGGESSSARGSTRRAATAACGSFPVTAEQTEGPFFSTGSPERASLRAAGIDGAPLALEGTVLSTDCTPIAGAKLDFWHADDNGDYDNDGFRLRGHQFADEQGRYNLETIVPALYTGRTRHIHVKVQAPNEPVLTTQLYFPGEGANAGDGIFDAALLMDVQDDGAAKAAAFDFVLEIG